MRCRWCAAPCCWPPPFPSSGTRPFRLAEQLNDLVRVMTGIRTEGDKLQVGDDAAQRGAHPSCRAAGDQAPVTDRSAAGAGKRPPGRSRYLQERLGPERPDLQARQGGRGPDRASAPTRSSSGRTSARPTGARSATSPAAPRIEPQLCWHPPKSGSPCSRRAASSLPCRSCRPRGCCRCPRNGRRVLNFGDKTQYGSQSKGLVLETRHGGPDRLADGRLDRLLRASSAATVSS